MSWAFLSPDPAWRPTSCAAGRLGNVPQKNPFRQRIERRKLRVKGKFKEPQTSIKRKTDSGNIFRRSLAGFHSHCRDRLSSRSISKERAVNCVEIVFRFLQKSETRRQGNPLCPPLLPCSTIEANKQLPRKGRAAVQLAASHKTSVKATLCRTGLKNGVPSAPIAFPVLLRPNRFHCCGKRTVALFGVFCLLEGDSFL